MSILIMFRRSKYLLATVVATTVLFLPVIAPMVTVNPKVSAESMDEARTNALKYVYTKTMAECIASDQLHKDEEDVQLSQKPETWMEDKTVKVSYLVDADDGKRECGFLLDSALRTLGYTNPADFFKDMGYSCTVTACSFRGNKEDQARNFQNVIKKKNLPTSATPAMATQIYLAAFQSECEGSIITDPSAAQISDGDNLKNELISIYSLVITDGAPKVTPSVYKYKLSNQTSDFESGRSYTCFDTAPKLRDASKAAAEQQMKEFGEKKRELYLKTALAAVCDESKGLLDPTYTSCVKKINDAFPGCYAKAFGGGTGLGSGANSDDVATKGDQGLANCLATATGTSADTFMTAFQSVKAELDALANSYQTSTSTQTDDSDDCPLPSNAQMRWLGCALFIMGRDLVGTLHDYIMQYLYVSPANTFSPTVKDASAGIRNIAIGLIVIAGLTMIISQALGFELFDAYTIKKLLPRMVVALLGVSLAWPLMKIFVILFNDLGLGVGSVLDNLSDYGTGTSSVGGGSTTLGAFFGTAAAGGVLVVYMAGGSLALLGTVALGLFIGMIVLAIRQVLILMCVVLAPIAIACYVLPGTQKIWAFWKNTFLTTLFMFPIIMLFIGAGRAASTIVGTNNQSGAMNILAILLYFAPYFLLPYAFKMAGGLMSTIFGIANDKNRGVFDRMKKFRGKKAQESIHAMKQGNRYHGNSAPARAFNRVSRGVGMVGSEELSYNPLKWRERGRAGISKGTMDEAREAMEKNQHFRAISANDDFLQAAVLHRGDVAGQKAYLASKGYDTRSQEDATAAIRMAQRTMSNDAFDTAAAMALPATGTAFRGTFNEETGEYEGGAGEMHDFINKVTGNDRNRAATMLAAMRSGATQARRFDLAGGGYGSQLDVMNKQHDNSMNRSDATRQIIKESLEGQGGAYIAGARKNAVVAFAPEIFDNLVENASTTAPDGTSRTVAQIETAMDKELAVLAGRYDAMSSVAPENARVLDDQVMSKLLNINGRVATVQQHIEARRANPEFVQLRREYASASIASSAAAASMGAGAPLPGPSTPPVPPIARPPGT